VIDRWTTSNERNATAEELLEMIQRPGWWAQAACRGVGVEIFFPHRGEETAEALAYCRRCSVTEQCRATADSLPYKSHTGGIWGGTTGRMRRRDRTQRWCELCGAFYTSTATGARYCGAECRRKARRLTQQASNRRRTVQK
jgi:hypothetical protein